MTPLGRLAVLLLGLCTWATLLGCAPPSPTDIVEGKPWQVTVYYTAVESFHDSQPVEVRGCLRADCANEQDLLGQYPRGFVDAVREEGSGRITSGEHAGRHLNWSYDIGYWLDTAPRDAHGGALEPFRSAAADDIPDGTKLRLTNCGKSDSGTAVPEGACAALKDGQWQIRDRFTPGLGGPLHIDLYIGEENAPHFTASGELYVSLQDAGFTIVTLGPS